MEVLKLEERTETQINSALKKKAKSIDKLIANFNKRLDALNREEEIEADQDDEDDEKNSINEKISTRAQNRITKYTKKSDESKSKVEKLEGEIKDTTDKKKKHSSEAAHLKEEIDGKT